MLAMPEILIPYKWRLSDGYPAKWIKYHGAKAFGTFVCGGGSTMGYKLAGYEHLGGVELTEHYSRLYRANHNPKYFYEQDIRLFNKRSDLPDELYELDLLDGSPPCASFSKVGKREALWGKTKDYEGHKQKTDDLLYCYADTVLKLRPKVFLTENVAGLISGNAKPILKAYVERLSGAYNVQVFSLNAASMGVPQMRQRVFIVGVKKEYALPLLKLEFDFEPISFETATKEFWNDGGESIERFAIGGYWDKVNVGGNHFKTFSLCKPALDRPCFTLTETMSNNSAASVVHPTQKRKLNKNEASVLQSFPLDYDFLDQNPLSCIGRSVPPVMTAQIANQIWIQWLSKIKSKSE